MSTQNLIKISTFNFPQNEAKNSNYMNIYYAVTQFLKAKKSSF